MDKDEKRTIKKNIWMNKAEYEHFKKAAASVPMTEAHFFRCLLDGYHPNPSPGMQFWDDMNRLMKASDALERVYKDYKGDPDLKHKLENEAVGLDLLRTALMDKYLLGPREVDPVKLARAVAEAEKARVEAAKIDAEAAKSRAEAAKAEAETEKARLEIERMRSEK